MGAKPTRLSWTYRFRQGAISLVAAYAFALQGILIGLVSAQVTTATYGNSLGFGLCLSHTQDDSRSPAPAPLQHSDHCIFCFAGAHLALSAPSQSYAGVVSLEHGAHIAITHSLPHFVSEYSIARPRGPPIGA